MSAKKNLAIAKLAVSCVREYFGLKAGNKLLDALVTGLKSSGVYISHNDGTRTKFSDGEVGKIRRKAKTTSLKLGSNTIGVSVNDKGKFGKLKWMAQVAKKSGYGNCNEHAACAFIFLHEIHRAKPLDLMAYDGDGDHVFVVIGRKKGSKAEDYTTWGKDAVVCDAWDEKSFLAKDVPKQLADYHDGNDIVCRLRLE